MLPVVKLIRCPGQQNRVYEAETGLNGNPDYAAWISKECEGGPWDGDVATFGYCTKCYMNLKCLNKLETNLKLKYICTSS